MHQSPFEREPEDRLAAIAGPGRIALVYGALATLWILVSDSVSGFLIADSRELAVISLWKGMAFVILTSLILYQLMRRMLRRLSRMHAQVALEQAARMRALTLLEVIVEKSTDAIYVKDPAGRYLLFNREAGRFVGKDSADVIGQDDRAIFLPGEAEELMAADQDLMQGGEVRTFEEVLTTPQGVCTFLTTKGPFYTEDGRLAGLFGIARNISGRKAIEDQLKRSEVRYRSLFEAMTSGFAYHRVEYDAGRPVDFTYLTVNSNFEALTGLKDVIGKRVSELIPSLAQSDAELFERYFRVTETGRPERFERQVKSLNMWFQISVFSTEPHHFAVIFDNITERVAVQEAMRGKTEKLEQSNADLEQFAYVASHDLQTPLRNIVSYSQMLEHRYKGRIDADADDFISFIVDSGKQMTQLLTDILNYSRITSQAQPLHPTEARDAVTHALKNLSLDLENTKTEVAVGPLPRVMADRSHLVSLFQNLLGNAIKYRSPDTCPQLCVTAEPAEPGWWRFAVRDNGIGIEPQYHEKIFEIFQRLNPATETEGTGIGLTLCRRIVHRFGGSIWVESAPGQGTTFFFTLRDGSAAISGA
jgi:PAS domain S-box-containing protein